VAFGPDADDADAHGRVLTKVHPAQIDGPPRLKSPLPQRSSPALGVNLNLFGQPDNEGLARLSQKKLDETHSPKAPIRQETGRHPGFLKDHHQHLEEGVLPAVLGPGDGGFAKDGGLDGHGPCPRDHRSQKHPQRRVPFGPVQSDQN